MEDPNNLHNHNNNDDDENTTTIPTLKPILRRSKSERSEHINFDNFSANNSSVVAIPKKMRATGGSILSISEAGEALLIKGNKNKKGKASSVISGAELREKTIQKGNKGKASSVVSDSIVSGKLNLHTKGQDNYEPGNKLLDDDKKDKIKANEKPPSVAKPNGHEFYGAAKGKFVIGGHAPFIAHSIISDSEVGPPPSEVAAMMTERRYPLALDDNQSSVLDGWSLDESVEGLKSKLERWRMELPPLYDRGGFSSSSYQSSTRQVVRRQSPEN